MKHLTKAVELAIQGGWEMELPLDGHKYTFKYLNEYWYEIHDTHKIERGGVEQGDFTNIHRNRFEVIFLDRTFWQSLGKKLWKEYYCDKGHQFDMVGIIKCPECISFKIGARRTWEIKWHSFIDHIAEGKPIDDFFAEIISNR